MFTELCGSAWENRTHRGWTTAASFAAQAMGIGLLLLLPIIYTQHLPDLKLLEGTLSVPVPPPGHAPIHPVSQAHRGALSNFRDGVLMGITLIPRSIPEINDEGLPPVDPDTMGVVGASGTSAPNGVLHSILSDASRFIAPPKPVPASRPPRVSRMMQGNLVHRVEPIYPPLARTARIQGAVQLQAIISKQGTIESLRLVSGHPMLAQAAVAAVQQWRYRPYELNGEPVEVETQITVNFVLSGT
jgi:periplasmic protein TonB